MDAKDITVEMVKYVKFHIGVYYWEDCCIDGYETEEDGSNVPFAKDGYWDFVLDLDNGRILGWEDEVKTKCPGSQSMNTYFKACDMVWRTLLDADMKPLHDEYNFYVPKILDFNDSDGHYGYGDYIGLEIKSDGTIKGWPKNNLEFFINDLIQDLCREQQQNKKE